MDNSKKNDHQVVIVGGGVAGLVAACELEQRNYSPILLEASDRVGGRVKTDAYAGFLLDHGFQVLLTAYPEANKYLDFEALNLHTFLPGSNIHIEGRVFEIMDPVRQPVALFKMFLSKVGSLTDKWKMRSLSQALKKKEIVAIFQEESRTTRAYLEDYGFSELMINAFFRPFFAGIFLESELETSSRMFEFVFKMFSEGMAAIPDQGMEEIPKQLLSKLRGTDLRMQTKVKHVESGKVVLENGEEILAKSIIVATDPHKIIQGLAQQLQPYRKVTNLYFSIDKLKDARPIIALVPDRNKLINNYQVVSAVSPAYAPVDKDLLSVSVVGEAEEVSTSLIDKIKRELDALSGGSIKGIEYLRSYVIPYALPILDDLQSTINPTNAKLLPGVYLAGDYMLNPSLNAAMASGRLAVEAMVMNEQFST